VNGWYMGRNISRYWEILGNIGEKKIAGVKEGLLIR
jgi:hypothetical protein